MKTKTDLYTQIVLTAIAILLAAHLLKDINLVSKANAGELDLSGLNAEQAEGETTFYIYENDKLTGGFGTDYYTEIQESKKKTVTLLSGKKKTFDVPSTEKIKKDKNPNQAYIDQNQDIPKYIITTKTGSFWLEK